jgi:sulfur-oxidizing protein SoxX
MARRGSVPSRQKPLASFTGLFAAVLLLATPAFAFTVEGDQITASLTGAPGDAVRGQAIVGSRPIGLCVLCHAGPFGDDRFQGSIGPNLAGVGSRLVEGQIRLRVVDARRLNPDSPMPSYFNTEGLNRVATSFQGRPILSADEIENVVAYLISLRAAP